MPIRVAVAWRACCVAAALVLASADAAEQSPGLLGATREQLLARYGEPRSAIAAGDREVLFFAQERVVLRNGVVVEFEPLATGPRRPPGSDTRAGAPPAGRPPPATEAPGVMAEPSASHSDSAGLPATAEPQFAIKSIRPPGPPSQPPLKQESTTPAAAPSMPVAPAEQLHAADEPGVAVPDPPPAAIPIPAAPGAAHTAVPPPRQVSAARGPTPPEPADEAAGSEFEEEVALAAAAPARTELKTPRVRGPDPNIPDAYQTIFTARTYLISLVLIAGGVAYLVARQRRRQLELAASAVSPAPFSAPAAGSKGIVFTAEFLSGLEWNRFEDLVAAYYSKTGVVVTRTNTGPQSPVHVKISWKGEPRPFAYVHCIAHPPGPIDPRPIQALFAALTADDVRRGYVVTTGKFNVAARDFAEEKHITLLPGEIFREKLNALPGPARAEIMNEIGTGGLAMPT